MGKWEYIIDCELACDSHNKYYMVATGTQAHQLRRPRHLPPHYSVLSLYTLRHSTVMCE
jgi:hypothetical protein